MRLLFTAARWEVITLLVAFGVVMIWRLCRTGSFAGLLRAHDGSFSPGRTQLLVITIGAALQYLLATIHDPSHLPAMPQSLVAALGGSQAIYLGTKAWSIFGSKRNNMEDS
jgi:hypothetical protein